MLRCLEIASGGLGSVSPNPMVGAVLVNDGKIISEGWHMKFGGPHAEVNALKGVSREVLEGSTLFVSLEPCSHYGKTPPCSDLIISNGIKMVVVAMKDPNPVVSGRGIAKMQENEIEVKVGVLEEEARELNRRFLTNIENTRPYVILKWAESADGYVGVKGERVQLTGKESMMINHKWRTEEDAILVGAGTIITDNPKLTVRLWNGRNPVRVAATEGAKIDKTSNIFNDAAKTLIIDSIYPEEILKSLFDEGIGSVIIEGGPYTHNKFLKAGLWDEIRVLKTKNYLKSGIAAATPEGTFVCRENLGEDEVLYYRNQKSI